MAKKCFLVLVMLYLITGFAQATTLDSQLELAISYNAPVVQYYHQGQFQKALPLAEKAVQILTKKLGEKNLHTLMSLDNLAQIYQELGRFSEALPLFETGYRHRYEVFGEKHRHTLTSLNGLALIYQKLGRLSEALPLFENGYRLCQEVLGKKDPHTLVNMTNLGELYRELGRFSEALPLFENGYPLAKEVFGEKYPNTLGILNNLALTYQSLGRLEEALPLSKKVYRLTKEVLGQNRQETLKALNNLVANYKRLGYLDQALYYSKKVYSLSKEVLGPSHHFTLHGMNNLAVIYRELDQLEEALALFQKGYRLSAKGVGKKHYLTLANLINLAELNRLLGKTEEALLSSEKSYPLSEELYGPNHPHTLAILSNWAIAELEAKQIQKAIKHLEKFVAAVENVRSGDLSAENRQALFKKWVGGYFNLSRLYLEQSRPFDAFRLSEMTKARTLLQSIAAKLAAQQGGLTVAEQRQLQDEEESLAFLNDRIAKALENNRLEEKITLETEKNQRVNKVNQFHRELMAKYTKYAQLSEVQIVGAKEGAKYLPADAVLISYLRLQDKINQGKILAFTLQSNGKLTAHDLGKIPDLENTVKKYRRRLKNTRGPISLRPETKKEVVALSRELGKFLLEPLKDIIKDKRRWIISPSGPLALIPFETLRLEGEDSPVIDKHEITYVQSLSVLKLLKEREHAYQRIEKRGTLLAMGAPIYETFDISHTPTSEHNPSLADINIARKLVDSSDEPQRYTRAFRQLNRKWRNLPGALKELERLEKLFFFKTHRLRIYKLADATEANLQRLDKFGILAKYRYLLFSTHGYLSIEVPALSSIVLGQVNNPQGIDGYVTAGEWPAYNLKSDLMVLSACETGVGEVVSGEGVMGLPYAFYVAGNKNTLLTLWSISDEVTADFIFSFFRKLKMGIGQVEALTATKREFIEAGYGEAYWAAFVLYGV